MTITDNLFLAVSKFLGVRVTPDNLRYQMDVVSSNGGVTNKVKTEMLQEILLAIAELEKKIDENK